MGVDIKKTMSFPEKMSFLIEKGILKNKKGAMY
jgi:hypothetical protein